MHTNAWLGADHFTIVSLLNFENPYCFKLGQREDFHGSLLNSPPVLEHIYKAIRFLILCLRLHSAKKYPEKWVPRSPPGRILTPQADSTRKVLTVPTKKLGRCIWSVGKQKKETVKVRVRKDCR